MMAEVSPLSEQWDMIGSCKSVFGRVTEKRERRFTFCEREVQEELGAEKGIS